MGSWGGVGMALLGGGLLGAGIACRRAAPWVRARCGIGAIAGFGIGVGEKLAASSRRRSRRTRHQADLQRRYPAEQRHHQAVVSIAQSQFGGDIAVAVRSPSVSTSDALLRSTGQKMPLSASTHTGSLVEQGGNLYQQASFQNNAWHSYASDLPHWAASRDDVPETPGPNTTAAAARMYRSTSTATDHRGLRGRPVLGAAERQLRTDAAVGQPPGAGLMWRDDCTGRAKDSAFTNGCGASSRNRPNLPMWTRPR